MGARINFVFDDGTESLTVLYSHWGESTWEDDLVGALVHAQPRHRDYSYFTRMVISHLIQEHILDETGFGIYSIARSEITELLDRVVVLDLVNDLLNDLDNNNSTPLYGKVFA
jgi:hypothetical protein